MPPASTAVTKSIGPRLAVTGSMLTHHQEGNEASTALHCKGSSAVPELEPPANLHCLSGVNCCSDPSSAGTSADGCKSIATYHTLCCPFIQTGCTPVQFVTSRLDDTFQCCLHWRLFLVGVTHIWTDQLLRCWLGAGTVPTRSFLAICTSAQSSARAS
mgnify:CR=1 FL=1